MTQTWAQFIHSEEGARYLARRVRAGAAAVLRETLRLEAWFAARAAFNHTRS